VARKSYGNTWWGQQFLQALQQIDYGNRLPRGKTYANKGAVKEINIGAESVKAKVQGSRTKPYQQTIVLKPFSASESDKIVQILLDNPFLLSQLLNRELPPGVEAELRQAGITVFPKRWADVQARCSCPDSAVPCKHLAAVIYLLANEVDQYPFLVFQLRGLDLIAALENAGMTASGALKANVPQVKELMHPEPLPVKVIEVSEVIESLDFSRIPASREKLLKLLPDQPAFYAQGNFKKELDQWYKRLSKAAQKFSFDLEDFDGELPPDLTDFYLTINTRHFVPDASLQTSSYDDLSLLAWSSPLPPLIHAAYVEEQNRQIAPLRLVVAVWQFALHLAQRSAIVPQVIESPDQRMYLRWLPAMVEPQVKAVVEPLSAAFPTDLVRFRDQKGVHWFMPQHEQLFFLIDALLSWFLKHEGLKEPDPDNPVRNLFFGKKWFDAEGLGEEETPYAIQQWLQRFYLAERQLVPVLQIEEVEPDFLLHFAVEDKTQLPSQVLPLARLFEADDTYGDRRLGVLQDFALLAEYLPEVQEAVRSKGEAEIYLDRKELVRVMLDTLPALELIGIRVLLPKALRKLIRPQAALSLETFENPNSEVGYLNLQEMLQFQWKIALGEQLMEAADFLAEVEKMRGLVKIQDQYVLIDEKEMQQLIKQLANPPELSHQEILQAALSETYEGKPVKLSRQANRLIKKLLEQELIEQPAGLLARFRPYQHRGYSWLYKNYRIGFGSILADDMGLGKTLQVIGLLTKLEQDGELANRRALVVVPTPLLSNWQRECEKFAPGLRVSIFHGPNRELHLDQHHVILTSYGVARSDQARLAKVQWRVLVIDEAQAIKNPSTAQAKALKKLKADTRIAMSGTPVENRLSEYWSIFDFTNRGYLNSLNRFKKQYIAPIEQDRDQRRLQEFRQITAPFILRRVKTDRRIISDLPDKIEQDQLCTLTPQQTALYQGVVENNLRQIEENEGIARAGMIFKLMTALKQICNHPSLYLKQAEASPTLSGKASLLLTLLEQIRDQNEKVLIFTQYKSMGDLIVKMLQDHFPEQPLFLHGGLSRKKRDQLVDTFQAQPFAWAFVLSLKAAGTGLNLTAANHVIHYDLWWNPAVEAQATDRAFRIGQQKNVQVSRFLTQGTFEEKINAMIQQKRELADLTVESGERWIGELSNQELGEVFRLVNESA
jgi:uncharacterized Zn finger protein